MFQNCTLYFYSIYLCILLYNWLIQASGHAPGPVCLRKVPLAVPEASNPPAGPESELILTRGAISFFHAPVEKSLLAYLLTLHNLLILLILFAEDLNLFKKVVLAR